MGGVKRKPIANTDTVAEYEMLQEYLKDASDKRGHTSSGENNKDDSAVGISEKLM